MKKDLFVVLGLSALCAFFVSCASVEVHTFENEVKSEKLVLNTLFEKDDYVLLDTVVASSDFVYFDNAKMEYAGDSLKYGYISMPENVVIDTNQAISIGKKMDKENVSALEIAKKNANYELIQKITEMNADTILEPVYTVETQRIDSVSIFKRVAKRCSYKVTVRAKAIQLKK